MAGVIAIWLVSLQRAWFFSVGVYAYYDRIAKSYAGIDTSHATPIR